MALEGGAQPHHQRPAAAGCAASSSTRTIRTSTSSATSSATSTATPALHRQQRLRHRQLGPAPAQPAGQQPRDVRDLPEHDTCPAPAARDRVPAALRPASAAAAFYLELESSLDYLDIDRPGSYAGQYGRADLFPQLTLPVRTFPWLNLAVTAGERVTYYSDSLNTDPAGVQRRGPDPHLPGRPARRSSARRSRASSTARWANYTKFKHVIEPRFTYNYLGDIDDPEIMAPRFDEVDTPRSTNTGRGRPPQPLARQAGGRERPRPARCCSSSWPAATASTTRSRSSARATARDHDGRSARGAACASIPPRRSPSR